MHQSRAWTYGLFIVSWLCWLSSLLIGAQNLITDPIEVTALRAIKTSLIDPNKNLNNWDQGDPCTSNWTGVVCHNATFSDDVYLHVDRLNLLKMNLSGSLSPQLGRISNMTILDFMWNNISGSIPKEIGNITSLELLLLNGNKLTGSLPEELGFLANLNRIQIDENRISGPIPISFSNLNKVMHFHMNNNSISGQIPPELSKLPVLLHFLVDNNNLSGYLPPEFSKLPNLQILQLDNNHFDGTTIPSSYSNMSKLLKLSLRNCSLHGPIPDLSQIPNLYYLDLSSNQLNGSIPPNWLSKSITTINLSNNNLTGTVPSNFSGLPPLQKLSIANNALSGSVPSTIWQSRILNGMESLKVELQNNKLSNITGSTSVPPNVTVWLQGNPVCSNTNLDQFCGSKSDDENNSQSSTNTIFNCPGCPPPYEYLPTSHKPCSCAAPLLVGYRLKSPGFIDFRPYRYEFENFLTSELELFLHQLYIDSFSWEKGPRLRMYLKIFPVFDENVKNSDHIFNGSEVRRIMNMFISWKINNPGTFGPYEVLNLTDVYNDEITTPPRSALSTGALVGIVLGTIAGAVALSTIVSILIVRAQTRKYHAVSRRRHSSKAFMKIDGAKDFTYREMAMATKNFNSSSEVGQGGYGNVYKGILADGTIVDIKHAQEGSLQGEKEFLTEIELLSRLHHRNLVSLIGYCDEGGEQVNMAYQSGMIFGVIDGQMGSYPSDCVVKSLSLALKCCQDETDARPSMAEAVRELENIWVIMPESDIRKADPMVTDVAKDMTPPSSSSNVKNPFVSMDLSGSNLDSGVLPTITPR